ncbi:DNA primase [Schleiferilactobacillus harbinensis]|uniref:DNA primase family protein n=1 Tax=Schleiferilactobacillus harbinensis TaxID=304207 RepID=UPI0012384A5A|nr:DNA primase family protein [Schleiferilactobacillus harbinensis]QEU48016.1 DNA primase [Schleiferilactobacillus harbinensis]
MDATKETPLEVVAAIKGLHVASSHETPRWLISDEKGNAKVNSPMLGYEIMKEVPMIRADCLPLGARYDRETGTWHVGDLSDFLEGYITKKLEAVGKWSVQKMGEVKKFIMIKTFNPHMASNPFDRSNPMLINFKNGTFNLVKRTLQPHNQSDLILQSHDYVLPTSQETPTEPKETGDWLTALTGNDPFATTFLFELMGYCFYRSYEPFQLIAILQGSGGNGKSTFLNYLKRVLGVENVSNVTLQDLGSKNNRFASSQLYRKEANIFADVDSSFLKSTGLLKSLTGGDRMFAEFKGQDPFLFENFAKLIFSANELPPFTDFSDGFERRLYVVPFPVKIDQQFEAKYSLADIDAEIPQTIAYALYLFSQAMKRHSLTESDPMKKAKSDWLKDSNSVARFVADRCHMDRETNSGEPTQWLFQKYSQYCVDEGIKSLGRPNFTKRLAAMGIRTDKPRVNGSQRHRYIHLFYDGDQPEE